MHVFRNSRSNWSVFGPVVSHPERRVSTTSSISSCPIAGMLNGMKELEVLIHECAFVGAFQGLELSTFPGSHQDAGRPATDSAAARSSPFDEVKRTTSGLENFGNSGTLYSGTNSVRWLRTFFSSLCSISN